MSMHCRELETLAKAGTLTNVAQLVKAIREDYRAVEARLSERLPHVA